MCTHMRQVFNRYTRQSFMVKCGKCAACQQEKAAARSRRIRAEYRTGYVALSVMLSYDRYAVPFVFRKDIKNECSNIKVYRGCVDYHARYGSSYDTALYRKKGYVELADVYPNYEFSNYGFADSGLKDLVKGKGCIGVLFYKDVQDFNKRLKQNLIRNYDYDDKFVYFVAGEYGGTSLRPHWHLLLFCKVSDEQIFRTAIRENWTYGDMSKPRRIEVAKDMAGYIASYVNRGAAFPPFLSANFPPKTHFSQGFGCRLDCFQLSSILEKVARGDLSYNIASKKSPKGFVSVLTPKYVLNKYFPRFKGDFRLSLPALRYVLRTCDVSGTLLFPESYQIDYSPDDFRVLSTRLRHARDYFIKSTGLGESDFVDYWQKAWICFRSNLLRNLHCSPDAPPLYERYYNLYELYQDGGVELPFGDFDFVEVNPNNFQSVIRQTRIMTDTFNNYCKYKDVNNKVLSEQYEEF